MARKVHYLSSIDPVTRTGICASCGPVTCRPKGGSATYWRCNRARALYDARIHRHGVRKGRNPSHYRKHVQAVCSRCGFVPENLCQMDVDHIDGNRRNNTLDNLATLCANCHRLKTFAENRARCDARERSEVRSA